MYLLMNDSEKIVVESVSDIENMDLSKYKIYSLCLVDTQELINDGEIRDEISMVLKGEEMTRDTLIEKVSTNLEISKSKVSKVVSKMKKEKIVFNIDECDGLGNILISIVE